jgi:hypothetical protein
VAGQEEGSSSTSTSRRLRSWHYLAGLNLVLLAVAISAAMLYRHPPVGSVFRILYGFGPVVRAIHSPAIQVEGEIHTAGLSGTKTGGWPISRKAADLSTALRFGRKTVPGWVRRTADLSTSLRSGRDDKGEAGASMRRGCRARGDFPALGEFGHPAWPTLII